MLLNTPIAREGKIALDAGIIGSEMVEADWKVSIRISDNGFGIPTDSLPFIFERYYQGTERSLGLESEGTGLGLAITKEIILLHSGTIEVESEIGKGTLLQLNYLCGQIWIEWRAQKYWGTHSSR